MATLNTRVAGVVRRLDSAKMAKTVAGRRYRIDINTLFEKIADLNERLAFMNMKNRQYFDRIIELEEKYEPDEPNRQHAVSEAQPDLESSGSQHG